MQIGSPSGAENFISTLVPGKQPISKSFRERWSSLKQQMVPFSPGFKSPTVFALLNYLELL